MTTLTLRLMGGLLMDLVERWRPTPATRAILRVADHGSYLIRHHRATGLAEVLNRRHQQISSWPCPSFHRAVAEARDRLDAPRETVLRNPWVHAGRCEIGRR